MSDDSTLMLDWTTQSPRPNIIRRSPTVFELVPNRHGGSGNRLCCYYTQAFWEHFGRAAVVPLRLDHALEKEDGAGHAPDLSMDCVPDEPSLPLLDVTEDEPCIKPTYETTEPSAEKAKKTRQNVAHMHELKARKCIHRPPALPPLQLPAQHPFTTSVSPLLAGKTPDDAHALGIRLEHEGGVLREDRFCRVLKNSVIGIGHHGEGVPSGPGTILHLGGFKWDSCHRVSFCRCKTADGKRGNQSFSNSCERVYSPGALRTRRLDIHWVYSSTIRMADPFFAGAVPDIYGNFLAISRFYESLQITIERGEAHGLDIPLPGEVDRPYPNRPPGFLGVNCAACPERGVNMPLVVDVASYLRHLISQNLTLDGNWKANLFFKHDDGSDIALTEGKLYFPSQREFEEFAKTYVVPADDKEVPCKANIGSIRHQGHAKYGNTAVSSVVACACDHTVLGSLVDMLKGEAFALGTYAQREQLRHTNSPPHGPESVSPINFSYDSWSCVEGQIPADHINGHGSDCKTTWQAVYFACRAHFHGETAEMIWAFLNPLGSSTRQMTGAWNTLKVLRAAELLAAERVDALRLFELHMAVVEDLSRQHATEVPAWSRLSRKTTKAPGGKPQSVYQHEETTECAGTMIAVEQEKQKRNAGHEAGTPIAQWIHDGMSIEVRSKGLTIALVHNHREHPLEDTWMSITKLRDTLNFDLKKFRERQREIFPRLKLSALDVDEPELTVIQLPSYRMKHGQWPTAPDANDQDSQLKEAEIKLRCTEADSGILAVRATSLALSAAKKAREQDYRGQAGITRSQRNLQKVELMKTFEITMYNNARTALIHLHHMEADAVEPYQPLSHRDTRRKETHLHRAKGDSRLFNGTAWYLQSGVTISQAAVVSPVSREEQDDEDDEPQLLAGIQTLKRSGGLQHNRRSKKRLRDIAPEDVDVHSAPSSDAEADYLETSPSKRGRRKAGKESVKKGKKRDGWIWLESLMRGQGQSDEKLAAYKKESDRVQWFRAEAEMYRWLEQYERKHAELFRVIGRYRRDSVVWAGQADREQQRNGGLNGKVAYGRMQAAIHRRLEHNAKVIFKSAESGAHHDWVSATSFDELVTKIDGWRDVVSSGWMTW
ncbi:hypothetical protein B0H13DRAFT_2383723 [Mycena leptocephala]|nr:hypothetical protein B0H13DRAFT_2383723 [Mycena leptocephala]